MVKLVHESKWPNTSVCLWLAPTLHTDLTRQLLSKLLAKNNKTAPQSDLTLCSANTRDPRNTPAKCEVDGINS